MKKKPMVFFIIILVVAMMLAGCGGSEGTSEPDQTEAAQTEQSEESAQEADTEGMGNLLSATYVDMMKNNEYLMSYKASIDFEGQSMEVESTIAVSGEKMAMSSSGDGFDSLMIIKEDKVYMVDHGSKTVTSWAQTQGEETGTIDTEGITYIGSGEEDGLVYEEYSTVDNNVKYYFNGKELEKIAVDVEGQTMVMDILEMSKDVPSSMFEIPAGYEEMEL